MDGFWEKCEKIVREGQKSEKNLSKKSREIFHELVGSNGIVAWAKMHIKQRNIYLTVCRLPN